MDAIVLGISGPLAAGKSYLATRLVAHLNTLGVSNHLISLDLLRRYVLWESLHPDHIYLRQQLGMSFNLALDPDTLLLPRYEFTQLLFSNPDYMARYRSLATPTLYKETKNLLKPSTVNILEWTFLEEEGYGTLLTHPVIHVTAPLDVRKKRLEAMPDFNTGCLERLKLDDFLPKSIVVDSNVNIDALLNSLGVHL